MDLNTPIEIAHGVTKPFGDCTEEDLKAAAELLEARAAYHQAAAGKGEPPKPTSN